MTPNFPISDNPIFPGGTKSGSLWLYLFFCFGFLLLSACEKKDFSPRSNAEQMLLDSLQAINTRAQGFLYKNDDSAALLATRALEFAHQQKIPKAQAEALKTLATVHNIRSNNTLALQLYDSALAIFTKEHDNNGIAGIYNGKGVLYMRQALYDTSMALLLRALRLREALHDESGMATVLNNIGLVYKNQHNFKVALDYYYRALELKQKVGDNHGVSNALNTIAEVYISQKDFKRGLELHRQALEIRRSLGMLHGVATSMNGIGTALKGKKEYAEAAKYYDSALSLRKQLFNYEGMMATYHVLSLMMLEQKKHDKAIYYARQGLQLADSLASIRQKMNLLRDLAGAYSASGDYRRAFEYQQQAYHLKDTIFTGESAKNTAELQSRYNLESKDKEIALLHSNENFRQLQVNSLFIGIILMSLLAALLMSLYFIRRRAHKRLQEAHTQIQEQQQIITSHNEQLESQNILLAQINKDKDDLLSIAAHDLKNPLNAIYNMAEMMLDDTNTMTAGDKKTFLEQIVVTSERMFALIKNLLDINALEQGQHTFQPGYVELEKVCASVAHGYEYRALAKNITLHFDAATKIVAYTDQQVIERIMDNLLSNAIKYSPEGKQVFIRLKTFIPEYNNTETPTQIIRLEVQDEGPGIREEELPKLFGKFSRLSNMPTGGEHSTGLGLSIVQGLVKALHGTIDCHSSPGKGALFIVEIPCDRTVDEPLLL